MKQKVVSFNYVGACRYTGYIDKSIELILECGHGQPFRKASQGVPRTANCRECDRLREHSRAALAAD